MLRPKRIIAAILLDCCPVRGSARCLLRSRHQHRCNFTGLHLLLRAVSAPRGILVPFQLHCCNALHPFARQRLNFHAHRGRLGPRDFEAFRDATAGAHNTLCVDFEVRWRSRTHTRLQGDDHRAQTCSRNHGSEIFAKPL